MLWQAGVKPATPPEPFHVEQVRKIVARMMWRKLPMFGVFPDLDKEDLLQEGLIAAHRAHGSYDPAKGQYSTHMYTAAARRILAMHRGRSRELRRIKLVARQEVGFPDPPDLDGGTQSLDDLAGWCRQTYRDARITFGNSRRQVGRRSYAIAQAAAVMLLQDRLNLDMTGMRAMLKTRRDLREVLGLRHVPQSRWFKPLATLLRQGKERQALAERRRAAAMAG